MPEAYAATTYAGYIAAEYGPAELGAAVGGGLYTFAVLPSAVSGTLARALGFGLGSPSLTDRAGPELR